MITKGDDYPLHQTPEPVAYTGANRNFYDRFFFNGYCPDGSVFFAAAMGIYPYLNILDGAFSVVLDGVQHNVYGSRVLHMERLDTQVGPISVEIQQPLRVLTLRCDDGENGVRADLTFTARCEVQEEPRFTRRSGSQMVMDSTRMTQHGSWSGWIEIKGKRIQVHESDYRGTRDRSWGIRGVGESDSQPNPESGPAQFYWLWAPLNFDDRATLYHLNDDAEGRAWNSNGVITPLLDHGDSERMVRVFSELTFFSGRRHAKSALITFEREDGEIITIELATEWNFYMRGIGYTHPEWRHGTYHGELATGYDEFVVSDVGASDLHVQAFCQAKMHMPDAELSGQGVLEQLILGPHKPSGFDGLLDMAP
ncbi:MAG: hypothetical protein QGI68_00170 [Pseudomonadales bacterium]|nr:hypothetical protein [Pseudomonadales bacterium]MDP7593973.1 hypothetical protein [Pseudomonadales bacterium]HJN48871.1 hypothetical protein [Pseudomonadales bacterium]